MLKELVQSTLKRFGLQLRKLSSHHTDLWGDELRLLSGRPVRVILDAGAFVGDTVAKFRETFPEADVYCFEPTGDPYSKLSARFKGDPKVHPVRMAIGERAGQATLHVNVFDQTNSLLPIDPAIKEFVLPGQDRQVATESVPVVSIDEFCNQRGIESVDILKMDIQGFELNALRGARGLLERRAIQLIATEVLFGRMYQGQTYYHDVVTNCGAFTTCCARRTDRCRSRTRCS
jgi:FkbM family methyltransferase